DRVWYNPGVHNKFLRYADRGAARPPATPVESRKNDTAHPEMSVFRCCSDRFRQKIAAQPSAYPGEPDEQYAPLLTARLFPDSAGRFLLRYIASSIPLSTAGVHPSIW